MGNKSTKLCTNQTHNQHTICSSPQIYEQQFKTLRIKQGNWLNKYSTKIIHNLCKQMQVNQYGNVNYNHSELPPNCIQQFLSNIVSWQVSNSLCLRNNKCTNIIQSISQIKFINLQSLYLQDNKITSIEPINKIDLKNLSVLNISENMITCFNTLRKSNLKNLFLLNYSHNMAVQFMQISQTMAPILQNYTIQFDKIEQILPLAKIQSKQIRQTRHTFVFTGIKIMKIYKKFQKPLN